MYQRTRVCYTLKKNKQWQPLETTGGCCARLKLTGKGRKTCATACASNYLGTNHVACSWVNLRACCCKTQQPQSCHQSKLLALVGHAIMACNFTATQGACASTSCHSTPPGHWQTSKHQAARSPCLLQHAATLLHCRQQGAFTTRAHNDCPAAATILSSLAHSKLKNDTASVWQGAGGSTTSPPSNGGVRIAKGVTQSHLGVNRPRHQQAAWGAGDKMTTAHAYTSPEITAKMPCWQCKHQASILHTGAMLSPAASEAPR